jgi:hypothetical protein
MPAGADPLPETVVLPGPQAPRQPTPIVCEEPASLYLHGFYKVATCHAEPAKSRPQLAPAKHPGCAVGTLRAVSRRLAQAGLMRSG